MDEWLDGGRSVLGKHLFFRILLTAWSQQDILPESRLQAAFSASVNWTLSLAATLVRRQRRVVVRVVRSFMVTSTG